MTSTTSTPEILMSNGKYFYYLEPERSEFTIEVIAHHLSQLCRFAGATRSFYSVAQHSVLVSRLVPTDLALNGLLHDAAEAFMVDVPSRLKRMLEDYRIIEMRVEREVLGRFGLPYPIPAAVKVADIIALYIEQRDLMPPHRDEWPELAAVYESVRDGSSPVYESIKPQMPVDAEIAFLMRYAELHDEENYSECPACHHWQQDEDGFGVLYCETCGYCTHASVDGTTCGFCKRQVVRA